MTVSSPSKQGKTTAERQAAYAARRRGAGLVRVSNMWAHPDDHAAIKAFAQKLTDKRAKDKPRD